MALNKEIELENGIVVSYHRIVKIDKITNNQTIIEVASYINETQRNKEVESIKNKEPMNVFINTEYLNKYYDENENIKEIYSYLKTLDKYKDAEDI